MFSPIFHVCKISGVHPSSVDFDSILLRCRVVLGNVRNLLRLDDRELGALHVIKSGGRKGHDRQKLQGKGTPSYRGRKWVFFALVLAITQKKNGFLEEGFKIVCSREKRQSSFTFSHSC